MCVFTLELSFDLRWGGGVCWSGRSLDSGSSLGQEVSTVPRFPTVSFGQVFSALEPDARWPTYSVGCPRLLEVGVQ